MRRLAVVAVVLLAAVCGVGGVAFQRFQAENQRAAEDRKREVRVERGAVSVRVVETGSLEAGRTVEVKSRVGGRIKRLLVDEGDPVTEGQLVAEIDPQETLLQVRQNEAQVRGAQAAVERIGVELEQRRVTARNAVARAESRLAQLRLELSAQPTLTSAAVRSAESALAAARQGLAELVSVAQPRERTSVETALQEARAALANAERDEARLRSLFERGYVARREVDSATLQLVVAESRLKNAEENLARLEEGQRLAREQASARVGQAEAELSRAQASAIQDRVKREELERAQRDLLDARAALRDVEAIAASRAQQAAQLDQLRSVLSDGQRQLGETKVVAPIAGIVTRRGVQAGELVASLNSFSAGTTIVRVEDVSRMVVKLAVNEIDVARLRLGMRAEVVVDAFPEAPLVGRVTKVAPTNTAAGVATPSADAVVKYAVEVTLDRPRAGLRSGMSARCTMKVVDRKDVLRIPTDYLGEDDKGPFVMLPGPDRAKPDVKAVRTQVKVGARSDAFVEIVSGVEEGQRLVRPPFGGPPRKGFIQFGPGDDGDEE